MRRLRHEVSMKVAYQYNCRILMEVYMTYDVWPTQSPLWGGRESFTSRPPLILFLKEQALLPIISPLFLPLLSSLPLFPPHSFSSSFFPPVIRLSPFPPPHSI
eukprot:TRINITY_DN4147_c0_g1_i1.p1 TRINITY_DN4147_c0_g1~~TRINITY_DN4147_c0_g1_i1.p1  ORF type:complete len:103 (-),score=10.12 TRINITY_DN4147_c0_g1_i1:759-1067(-)